LNAAPSSAVFRTSVFALLAASVLALWLLIRPPSLPGEGSTVVQPRPTEQPQLTPSGTRPAATPGGSAATPGEGDSIAPTATPVPEQTPAAAEETPAPETEPPGPIEYVVQEGDTWYGIAGAYGVDADSLAAVNGLTIDDVIVPGDVLVIPQ
jgi:LysM repeat protein